jgi:nucleoside-diphosphate-sugar epimerase
MISSGNVTTGKTALVVGVTGIQGNTLAAQLVARGWAVHGIARRPHRDVSGVNPIAVDLTDAEQTRTSLAKVDTSHVFFCTWSRQATETENCAVNGGMLRNLLEAVGRAPSLQHVALVTGLKHYMGPFEAYGVTKPETPFREDQPRLPTENFYYTQEDILFEAAARRGFSWSVHRPHTVIGWAIGNAMNMGVTLAVYGTICRETGLSFVFPGSPQQYDAVTDVTDSRILAKHLIWAATSGKAANQAFNIVNGDVFRWRRMWRVLANWFGVAAAAYPGHPTPLVDQMKGVEPVWKEIVRRHGLVPHDLETLASWWHTDADLGRQIETLTDMSKSRRLGFTEYQETDRSFLDLFERLRSKRVIP